ncbi:hypothetical protein KIH39_04160 [Telmatocola sphagniphila]|uniref:Zinc ribbon domain-containing protein n=1 Tax=Telmatocola sphagniphila TaxID=1123043 RepID=A0A8E6B750_9BACT|nr:hypothetical protein [Telmatocola sphagniphila]QVL33118.1 hypothetical protein KIH39_04160 [Telmatocola sphagniphila]
MPRTIDEEEFEDDYESEDWHYEVEDSMATTLCKYCQEEIPEDTPRCPYCATYLSEEDHPVSHTPNWVKATAIILLLLTLVGFLYGF